MNFCAVEEGFIATLAVVRIVVVGWAEVKVDSLCCSKA